MIKIYKEHQELLSLLKHYFSQDIYKPEVGHVPAQFVKFIGCKACLQEKYNLPWISDRVKDTCEK